MIDFSNLEKYRENNRIEAKKALGGLPNSLWETYSAFANTLGGLILLGVEEQEDKSLKAINLPDPNGLIKAFWDTINNPNKVNVNILSESNVTVETVDGNRIVAIRVPRAQRYDKPVFIDGNPLSGTYRRNGEGDYRCTKEEVQSMMRDAAIKSQDMLLIEDMSLDVFDYDSVHRYRQRMKSHRPGHVWEELSDTEFLYRLGAVGRSTDSNMHPTAAGLLMFGYEYEIVKEYPAYFLDYQERLDGQTRWTDRIVSSSGDWSGNLYDFYFRVYHKITQSVKVPFKMEDGDRIDDTPVHKALREALANCIINADYYGRQGLVIIRDKESITFSNPGAFRIDIEDAKCGGFSDPRNAVLIKMFNLINIGERAGSGIPNILSIWQMQGWKEPTIREAFEPERIIVSLLLEQSNDSGAAIRIREDESAIKIGDKKSAIKIGDKKSAIKCSVKEAITDYLTENASGKTSEIAEHIGLKASRTRDYLKELALEDIIVAEGHNRNRVYRLKS